jgi:hypothetical protein
MAPRVLGCAPVIRRRTLTPTSSPAVPAPLSTRRRDARRESSERVILSIRDRDVTGWTLNQSLGGIRAIVEEPLELGADLWVAVGADQRRPGRIVWLQEERDGSIVGIAFLDRGELEA